MCAPSSSNLIKLDYQVWVRFKHQASMHPPSSKSRPQCNVESIWKCLKISNLMNLCKTFHLCLKEWVKYCGGVLKIKYTGVTLLYT